MAFPDDFRTYYSVGRPNDDTSQQGGTVDLAAGEVSETTPNALFASVAANAAGGADILHRMKLCRVNEGTGTVGGPPRFWIDNGIGGFAVAGAAQLVIVDGFVGQYLVSGYVGGVPDFEFKTVAGNGTYNLSKIWDIDSIWRCEALSAGGALLAPTGPNELWRGTKIATFSQEEDTTYCPILTREFELWVEPTVSGTATAANRLTDPAGSTFLRAYTELTALLIGAGLDVAEDAWAAYWLRRAVKAGLRRPINYTRPIVKAKFAA